jgi:hypothetical protein
VNSRREVRGWKGMRRETGTCGKLPDLGAGIPAMVSGVGCI